MVGDSRKYFSQVHGTTFYSANNAVACLPLESTALESRGTGFKTFVQKTSLLKTKVVYGNEKILPGSVVYVRGDVISMAWTKEVYEDIGGNKIVLVPEDRIVLVQKPEGIAITYTGVSTEASYES